MARRKPVSPSAAPPARAAAADGPRPHKAHPDAALGAGPLAELEAAFEAWFQRRGWTPFDFQREVWAALGRGGSGLLHATTGAGKTYAVALGALAHAAAIGLPLGRPAATPPQGRPAATPPQGRPAAAPPLGVLWLTPMRALAADSLRALGHALADLAPAWTLGQRTGDTAAAERARQDRRLPTLLVTTPESLCLLLTRADAAERLGGVHTVVVDEWHELIGGKRGVQVQLALARLARWRRERRLPLAAWGLSATLGNLDEALQTLTGGLVPLARAAGLAVPDARLVQGRIDKALVIDTLLPAQPGRFSWGGHLGAQMRQPVAAELARLARPAAAASSGLRPHAMDPPAAHADEIADEIAGGRASETASPVGAEALAEEGAAGSTPGAAAGPMPAAADGGDSALVFTNVRSQAEAWYQMLLAEQPDWAGEIALHHGSLDKSVREWVEAGLKAGRLRAVVATSSLDLGVDFVPVSRVLQIGSPKGVARLLQRAGRSGHQPGRPSRITLVPTHTLELIEAVAVRRAIAAGRIEPRQAPEAPLDVLVQHLVTVALGGGFEAEALFDEVRSSHSYRALSREAFQWALDFVVRGGESLRAYPEYHRVVERDGIHRVEDRGIALRHRLQVGTIVGDTAMLVKWLSSGGQGGTIGQIEEGFIARLKPGDHFVFAGRVLEYVRTREMVAYVRRGQGKRGIVPSWAGGKMSLSSELADATLAVLQALEPDGRAPPGGDEPELAAARPMLETQARLSHLPRSGRLLVEQFRSREGHHLFAYPFAGRLVHLGLASLLAFRLARERPNTFSIGFNDYGFELLAAEPLDLAPLDDGSLFQGGPDLLHDVLASLNHSELAQRRFREIARVAGLVFSGYPGAPKSTRQLQASSGLFYEVFRQYDPANRLLQQAEAEVLAQELDVQLLAQCLARLRGLALDRVTLAAPSPFALGLMVERFREQLSTERLSDRLARILADAERLLAAPVEAGAPGAEGAVQTLDGLGDPDGLGGAGPAGRRPAPRPPAARRRGLRRKARSPGG